MATAPKRYTNPFPPLKLKREAAAQLEGLAHAFVRNSMEQYERFAFDRRHEVDEGRWKFVLQRENMKAYGERRGVPNEHLLPDEPVTDIKDLPVVLLVGTIGGTLDDTLYGDGSPTLEAMRIKTAYIEDELVSCAVLATLVQPTAADPFRSVVIKWFEKGRPLHVRALVKNRDFVFLESTGTDMLSNGERIGYHLIHSVQFPETPELDSALRGNLSFTAIFRQRTDDTVDVYIRGAMNPAGGLMRSIIIKSAISGLISSWKYVQCAQMKKLAWLLRRRRATFKIQKAAAELDELAIGPQEDARAAGRSSSCPFCGKKSSKLSALRAKPRSTCKICLTQLCSSCKVKKKLFFITKDQQRLVSADITFCNLCVTEATQLDALEVAKDEFACADVSTWSEVYAQSSASSSSSGTEFSPNGSDKGGRGRS